MICYVKKLNIWLAYGAWGDIGVTFWQQTKTKWHFGTNTFLKKYMAHQCVLSSSAQQRSPPQTDSRRPTNHALIRQCDRKCDWQMQIHFFYFRSTEHPLHTTQHAPKHAPQHTFPYCLTSPRALTRLPHKHALETLQHHFFKKTFFSTTCTRYLRPPRHQPAHKWASQRTRELELARGACARSLKLPRAASRSRVIEKNVLIETRSAREP